MKQILVSEKLLRQVLDYVEKGNPGHIAYRINVLVELRAALEQPAVEPVADLVDYILQDDTNNRLTPRVVDIAYSAFVIAKQGKNTDDGGPCDWFNDTLPMVMKQLAKIKKDLAENAALARESAPQAQPIPLAATCHCACVVEGNKVVEYCKMHGSQQPEGEQR